MIGPITALRLAVTLAVACLGASAGQAQEAACRLCAADGAAPVKSDSASPIRLEVRSRLDFDRLVFAGTSTGMLAIGADGLVTASGGVSTTGARAMPGSVTIRGEPGRAVRVIMPRAIRLYGERGALEIDSVTTDLPAMPTIGADGELTFRFGGTLNLDGDLDGAFRGDVDIVVDYL